MDICSISCSPLFKAFQEAVGSHNSLRINEFKSVIDQVCSLVTAHLPEKSDFESTRLGSLSDLAERIREVIAFDGSVSISLEEDKRKISESVFDYLGCPSNLPPEEIPESIAKMVIAISILPFAICKILSCNSGKK